MLSIALGRANSMPFVVLIRNDAFDKGFFLLGI
jgi:hypothetical protein